MEPESIEPAQQLTDEQWGLAKDLFPTPTPGPHGGCPRADAPACFEGILWVLRTAAHWKDLAQFISVVRVREKTGCVAASPPSVSVVKEGMTRAWAKAIPKSADHQSDDT